MKRLPYVPMVYFESRRAGFWAHQAVWIALWRFLCRGRLRNRTNRDTLLTLGVLARVLERTGA
jgi:hypothetical protein